MTKSTQKRPKLECCSWPGCTDKPWRRGGRCWAHHAEREIPGYRDVYCKLCGFGPRVALQAHIRKNHGGAEAVNSYRREFGAAALESEGLRFNRQALLADRIDDGSKWGSARRRKGWCAKGHRMVGNNLVVYETKHGTKRACHKCILEWERQRRLRDRPPFARNYRKCHWCGGRYWPTKKNQRFCSPGCQQHFFNDKYRAERQKDRGHRKCEHCGLRFTPHRSDQRFCTRECAWRVRYDTMVAAKPPKPVRVCSVCGDQFVGRVNQVVCSADCRAEDARRRARAHHQARRTKSPAPR